MKKPNCPECGRELIEETDIESRWMNLGWEQLKVSYYRCGECKKAWGEEDVHDE